MGKLNVSSRLGAGLIVLATLLVYFDALSAPLHFDDAYRVKDNPGVETFWPPWRHFSDPSTMATAHELAHYRPLLPLTLSINFALHGRDLRGYHLVNLAIHLLSALVLWSLSRRLLAAEASRRGTPDVSTGPALFATLLFAVHPIGGIGVNYICIRDLQMATLFSFLALDSYLRWRQEEPDRSGRQHLAWLALAMFAKQDAVVVPLLFYLAETTVLGTKPTDAGLLRRVANGILVVGTILAIPRLVLGHDDFIVVVSRAYPDGPIGYLATQLWIHTSRYLPNFILVDRIQQAPLITTLGPESPRAWLGALVVVASLAWAWAHRSRHPVEAFLVAGYWCVLAPSSSVVPLYPPAVDYRLIPASAFFSLWFVLALRRLLEPRFGLIAGIVGVALTMHASRTHNARWKDPELLFRHSVSWGANAMGYVGLANAAHSRSEKESLLRQALRLIPGHATASINLALLLLDRGRRDEAVSLAERAAALNPHSVKARSGLGEVLAKAGRHKDAIETLRGCIRQGREPWVTAWSITAARSALVLEDPRAAIALLEPVAKAPTGASIRARSFLAKAWAMAGDPKTACRISLEALALDPEDRALRYEAGVHLQLAGRSQEAEPLLARVVAEAPAFGDARFFLGQARVAIHDIPGAIAAFQEELVESPDRADVRRALEDALADSTQAQPPGQIAR